MPSYYCATCQRLLDKCDCPQATPADPLDRDYADQVEMMKAYLLHCFNRGDWHGVMDAAADIRELEAEERGRLSVLPDTAI